MKFINFIKSLVFTEPKVTEEGAQIKKALVDLPLPEAPVAKPKRKKVANKK